MTVPEARPVTGTGRIRWTAVECGTVASWFGYAGSAEPALFSILHPVGTTSSEHRYDEWALTASFPGAQNETRYAATREPEAAVAELKAEAERWLEEYVRSLGAIFPEAVLKLADALTTPAVAADCLDEELAEVRRECATRFREAVTRALDGDTGA